MSQPAGDTRCQQCGMPNPVWFAPSVLWNEHASPYEVLCPTCFMLRADDGCRVFRVSLEEPAE